MSKLENLIAGHAYWSDKKRAIKAKRLELFHKCTAETSPLDSNFMWSRCYDKARKDQEEESDCYGSPLFEDCFLPIACDTCLKHWGMKSELANASRRLGCIRAAMTKVGRGLDYIDSKGDSDE